MPRAGTQFSARFLLYRKKRGKTVYFRVTHTGRFAAHIFISAIWLPLAKFASRIQAQAGHLGAAAVISINRILATTDFSQFSMPALTCACEMAKQFGSELHLLHVCPDAAMLIPESGGVGGIDLFENDVNFEQLAMSNLQKLPDADWNNGRSIVRATQTGFPFIEINRYSIAHEIDLIVMGTHGRSGLSHLLMGSVTEKVLREAACPVLTVKPDGHRFVQP